MSDAKSSGSQLAVPHVLLLIMLASDSLPLQLCRNYTEPRLFTQYLICFSTVLFHFPPMAAPCFSDLDTFLLFDIFYNRCSLLLSDFRALKQNTSLPHRQSSSSVWEGRKTFTTHTTSKLNDFTLSEPFFPLSYFSITLNCIKYKYMHECIRLRSMKSVFAHGSAASSTLNCEMASRLTHWSAHNSHHASEFWLIQDLHKPCVGP